MLKVQQKSKAGDYVTPLLTCMEVAIEEGISISDTTFTVPDFGDNEQEW